MDKIFVEGVAINIKTLNKFCNNNDGYEQINDEIENLNNEKISDYLAYTRAKKSYLENEINIFTPSASSISLLSLIITIIFGIIGSKIYFEGLEIGFKRFIGIYVITLAVLALGIYGISINYITKLNKQVKYLTYIENKLQFKKDNMICKETNNISVD